MLSKGCVFEGGREVFPFQITRALMIAIYVLKEPTCSYGFLRPSNLANEDNLKLFRMGVSRISSKRGWVLASPPRMYDLPPVGAGGYE